MTGLGKTTADLMRVGAQIRCLSVLEVNLTYPIPKANKTSRVHLLKAWYGAKHKPMTRVYEQSILEAGIVLAAEHNYLLLVCSNRIQEKANLMQRDILYKASDSQQITR